MSGDLIGFALVTLSLMLVCSYSSLVLLLHIVSSALCSAAVRVQENIIN